MSAAAAAASSGDASLGAPKAALDLPASFGAGFGAGFERSPCFGLGAAPGGGLGSFLGPGGTMPAPGINPSAPSKPESHPWASSCGVEHELEHLPQIATDAAPQN